MLCQYKDIFGKPNEGFHSDRFLGFAANDLFGTILIGLFISYYFKLDPIYTFILLALFVIATHRLFCVNTALNVAIFGQIK